MSTIAITPAQGLALATFIVGAGTPVHAQASITIETGIVEDAAVPPSKRDRMIVAQGDGSIIVAADGEILEEVTG